MARHVNSRRGEAGVALVLLGLGIYVAWTARAMPAGTIALPGPGFFPTALGVLLALAALGVLVRIGLQRGAAGQVELGHRNIAIALAALLGVALIFEPVGAIPTLGLLLLVLFKAFARIAWWKAALGAIIGMALTWLVFVYLLGVQLPGAGF